MDEEEGSPHLAYDDGALDRQLARKAELQRGESERLIEAVLGGGAEENVELDRMIARKEELRLNAAQERRARRQAEQERAKQERRAAKERERETLRRERERRRSEAVMAHTASRQQRRAVQILEDDMEPRYASPVVVALAVLC